MYLQLFLFLLITIILVMNLYRMNKLSDWLNLTSKCVLNLKERIALLEKELNNDK